MGILRKARQEWHDRRIPNWPVLPLYVKSDSEELVDANNWLRSKAQISSTQQLYDIPRILLLISSILIRKFIYVTAVPMVIITSASFILLVFLIALFKGELKYSTPYASYLPFIMLVLAIFIILKFWSGGRRPTKPITFYLSKKLSEDEKDNLVKAYELIRSGSQEVILRANNVTLRKFSDECLNAENSFLLFTGKSYYLLGVVLLERYPQGDICVLENKYTYYSRKYEFQTRYLSNIESLKSTYDNIDAANNDGRLDQKPLQINKSRQARLDAMQLALDNPEFWESDDRFQYLSNNPELKIDLLNIFKEVARNKNTLSVQDIGGSIMHEFIDLNDRPLENWLRKLKKAKII